jgi:hypothetical protein
MTQDCNLLGLEHWFVGVILERNCTVYSNFVNSVCFQSKFVWPKFMWLAPVFLACIAKTVQVALNKRSQCMIAIHPSNSTSYLASTSSTQNVYLQAGGLYHICRNIIKFMFHFSWNSHYRCGMKFMWITCHYYSFIVGLVAQSVKWPTTGWMVPDRIPVGTRFSARQTDPGAHKASCTMGTGSFPGVKCGWGMLLTTHPILVPWS